MRAARAAAFRLWRRVATAIPGARIEAFGQGSDRIGAVLVINLDRKPRRMARTLRELARFKDRRGRRLADLVTRLSAVDARDGRAVAATADVDPRYLLGHQLYVQPDVRLEACFGRHEAVTMTRQEVAVARSHIEAWKIVAGGDDEHVLILEDDVWFRGDAASMIDRAWRDALADGNGVGPAMLYLSYEDAGGTCERVDAGGALFRPVRGLWFLSGYVLSRSGARALLRAMPVVGPVDMWINRQFERVGPLAVIEPVILQRTDSVSDNAYSVLPFLAKAGIVDAKATPGPRRSSDVRIMAWTDRGVREPLAMAMSMLGLRVLTFDAAASAMTGEEVAKLFDTFDVLVDPPVPPDELPDPVVEIVTGLILEAPRSDQIASPQGSASEWTILPHHPPDDGWWPPLCALAGVDTPAHAFPRGAPSGWRLFRDGRHGPNPGVAPVRAAIALAMDDTPWAIEVADGWPRATAHRAFHWESSVAEIHCALGEQAIEMTPTSGTFPGNLASFRPDAIRYGSDGATISLCASGTEDRPFRSGALASVRRFLHGRFEVEMRAARGDGLVTGFFLHRSAPRQEIDVEIMGNLPTRVLLNVYFNPGGEGAAFDYGYRGSPCAIELGFDASLDFHRYAIKWWPDRILWFVDGDLVHGRESWDPTPIPHLPMTLHANLWAPASAELAGVADQRRTSGTANFRNIRIEAIDRPSNSVTPGGTPQVGACEGAGSVADQDR